MLFRFDKRKNNITKAITNIVLPVITGTLVYGYTLSCSTGTWENVSSNVIYTYQWTRNGVNILNAVNNTYTLTSDDVSCVISCKVRASSGNRYLIATAESVTILMYYNYDSFTAADGTTLTSRSGEYNGSWVLQAGSTTLLPTIQNNRLYPRDTNAIYRFTTPSPVANYSVVAEFECITTDTSDVVGIMIRAVNSSTSTYYYVRYSRAAQTWALFKVVSGSISAYSSYSDTFPAAAKRVVELKAVGTSISVIIDGTVRITLTDSSITDAGSGGIRSSIAVTGTTGIHYNYLYTKKV